MEKYSNLDGIAGLGFLLNAMDGGGDKGQSFPRSDAEDMSRGLRFMPGEVTMARRRGERVPFYQLCENRCCWYWEFSSGARTYYWESGCYEQIAASNGITPDKNTKGVGACPLCGNRNTNGGHIERGDVK